MRLVAKHAPLLLVLFTTGCYLPIFRPRPLCCLSGRPPHVGRPVPDAMFALMRRELARAEDERRPAIVRAAILETIPSLIPDVSDMSIEPSCAVELRDRLHRSLSRGPLRYSRLALAQLRTLRNLGDTSDVMDQKGESLVGLSQLDDAHVAPYTLSPGEDGPPPPASLLRLRAFAALAGSNLFLNVRLVRQQLTARVFESTDDREQLLLMRSTAPAILESSILGHTTRAEGEETPRLLRQWIADTRRRLDSPGDRVAFELVRTRLAYIGAYAVVAGLAEPARELLQHVLAARGELPLAAAADAGAIDLAQAARSALYDIEVPFNHLYGVSRPEPESAPFDAWQAWIESPPTKIHFADVDREQRVRELDDELRHARFNQPRCHLVNELRKWAPASDAERVYAELLAPVFDGARLQLTNDVVCRLYAALDMETIPAPRRIALANRILATPLSDIANFDMSADEHHPALAYDPSKSQVWLIALSNFHMHPQWIEASPEARAWIAAHAMAVDFDRHSFSASQVQEFVVALLDELLDWDVAHDQAQGRQLLQAWLDRLRRDPERTKETCRMAQLARFARRFGLTDAAITVLRELLEHHAPPTPEPGYPDIVRRNLTLALYRLQLTNDVANR